MENTNFHQTAPHGLLLSLALKCNFTAHQGIGTFTKKKKNAGLQPIEMMSAIETTQLGSKKELPMVAITKLA